MCRFNLRHGFKQVFTAGVFTSIVSFEAFDRVSRAAIRIAIFLFTCFSTPLVANSIPEGSFVNELPSGVDTIRVETEALCETAEDTSRYLSQTGSDQATTHPRGILPKDISLSRVVETLEFICEVSRSAHRSDNVNLLADHDFLIKHFDFYRWYPDKLRANSLADKSTNKIKARLLRNIPSNQILLTRYYVKKVAARQEPDSTFRFALYALPYDELTLTEHDSERARDTLTRFRFSRQDIMAGALEKQNLAKALIWLDEDSLHDAMLQGTVVAELDGGQRYFNVDKHNGIKYNYELGSKDQARYWYFKEVDGVLGFGREPYQKIQVLPQVTVAGNVDDLGLGKLFFIQQSSSDQQAKYAQLAILADEGGAFSDNLFQLDLLVGEYWGWNDYHADYRHLSDYAEVWMMLKKQK
jgi:hypothetical protein